jgi:hypothetical protein
MDTQAACRYFNNLVLASMPTNKPSYRRDSLNGSHQAGPEDAGTPASSGLVPASHIPGITCSEQALAFPATPAGKPQFKTFTIEQKQANSPVTLTTNDPDNFQLASDSHPNFAPSLTLNPPIGRTHIHVRYVAAKAGRHSAELHVEAAYSTQTVSLSAQSVGMLQGLLTRSAHPLPPVVPAGSRWVPGVVLIAVAGLGLFFYAFRCQLAPGLCTEPVIQERSSIPRTPEPVRSARVTAPARETGNEPSGRVVRRTGRAKKRVQQPVTVANSATGQEIDQRPARPVNQPLAPTPAADTALSGSATTSRRSPAATRRPGFSRPDNQVQKKPLTAPAGPDESELERVLNGKPGNQ